MACCCSCWASSPGYVAELPAPLLALAASGAVFTIGYIGFWGAWNAADLWGGIRYVGPFYLMPVLLPVVLCGARGLADLFSAARRAAVATGAVAATAILAVSGVVLGFAISGNAHFTSQDRRLTALVDRPGQSIVFVATDPPFLMHPSAVLSNPPLQRSNRSADPDRLFAVSRGADDLAVLNTHPGRSPWLLRIHGALAKHLHVGETAQLYAVRDLRGQQVVVPMTLTAPIGTAELQLQVSTGKQKLTYELPTSGTSVQLRVRPDAVEIAGMTPDRVDQLRHTRFRSAAHSVAAACPVRLTHGSSTSSDWRCPGTAARSGCWCPAIRSASWASRVPPGWRFRPGEGPRSRDVAT